MSHPELELIAGRNENPVTVDPSNAKKWTKTFREPVVSGLTKEFNLRLYAAAPEGSQQIKEWLRIGNKTGGSKRSRPSPTR